MLNQKQNLMSRGCILAEIPDFGSVSDCGNCRNIHVAVGNVSLTLSPRSFLELVVLIQNSAANFETWQAQKRFQRPERGTGQAAH